MNDRSQRREVRNPALAVKEVRDLLNLSAEAKAPLAHALRGLRRHASDQSQKCWRTHKAPMALYWKAVAVYAGHFARVLS